jgi:hypothetical protein
VKQVDSFLVWCLIVLVFFLITFRFEIVNCTWIVQQRVVNSCSFCNTNVVLFVDSAATRTLQTLLVFVTQMSYCCG